MGRSISFYVSGEPKAQARPRAFAFQKGGKTQVRVYDPKTAEAWKTAIALAARESGITKFDGPVVIELYFSFRRPKHHFRTNGQIKESAPQFYTQKPDLDNAYKSTTDALTVVGAWGDDAQIVRATIDKGWAISASQGGCLITISEVG